MKNAKNLVVLGVILILVVGGGAFYGGMKYGQTKGRSGMAQQFGGPNGAMAGQKGLAGAKGGSLINGEVISKDDKSVTVKLQNGGSKIVLFSDSTTVGKTTDGVLTDLEVGKTVMVTGTSNADGSVTAQSIQIRPATTAPVPAK